MVRVYLPFFLALVILAIPNDSAGQGGHLTGLNQADIVVEDVTRAAKELGLSKNRLTEHTFVFLKSKLPRLTISKDAIPFVHVSVNVLYATTEVSKTRIGFF